MLLGTFDIGDIVKVKNELRNEDGDLFNPNVLSVTVKKPDMSVETFVYGTDVEVVRSETGKHFIRVSVDQSGEWVIRWFSTGDGQASQEDTLEVRELVAAESGSLLLKQRRLEFVCVKDGSLLSLASAPRLSNPSASFGVMRLDTRATVVNDNTAMLGSAGDYYYEFSEPDLNLEYRYYVEATHDAVTYYLPRTTDYLNSCALVIGRYCTSLLVETQYGIENVHKWLAIDERDEAVDYAMRFYNVIRDAEAQVDDFLRGGTYSVPFDVAPTQIASIAATLAGVKAYESRGVIDTDQESGRPLHRLQHKYKQALNQLASIRAGDVQLDVDRSISYPVVMEEDDDETTQAEVLDLWQL